MIKVRQRKVDQETFLRFFCIKGLNLKHKILSLDLEVQLRRATDDEHMSPLINKKKEKQLGK